jgi:hypothetical protein
MNNLIGFVLLVLGVGLLIWGFNLYGAFSSHVTRVLTGSPSDKTVIVLIAGAVCTTAGVFLIKKSR